MPALPSQQNVGTGKTVSVSGINVTGTDAVTTLSIPPPQPPPYHSEGLAVTATGTNKVYDGLLRPP